MKWLRHAALVLAVLMVALAAVGGGYASRVLPQTDGTLALAGAQAPLAIERDANGIPTIRAASLHDAYFGLGVAHAQDRLWQMETHRRIVAGRLAEAFGAGAVDNDRFLRALGIRRAAAAQYARLPPASKAVLDAYTAGVNAVVASLAARPPEYVVLGLHPEPWDPVDSLGWAIMMAWDLGANWHTELLRLRLALQLPVAKIDALLPPYPGEAPLAVADYAALFRGLALDTPKAVGAWTTLPDVAPASGVEGVGSNNWVVAGHRSRTGHPLLANDPHLKLSAPALWYFARLEAPGLSVGGATLPGLPAVVLGQNADIAWGFTNTSPDVQDLYVERIDPADATRYQTPDGWAAFETGRETIRVKGGADVDFTWRRTRHGPVISDAGIADDVRGGAAERPAYALALRWTALDTDSDAVGTAQAMQSANSVAAFVAATADFVAPMQNMVVADRAGHIGVVSPGRLPLRKPDNDLRGLVPAPGWDARYDWAGFVAAGETPRTVDPPGGAIATANQRITAPGYPHHVTSEWALPYRQQRIEQLLQARERHSLDDFAAMQADVKSLAVAPLLPWFAQARSDHPLAADAIAAMQGFDGTMAGGSTAPLVWWAWQRQLAHGVFGDDVTPELWQRSLATRSFQDALEGVLARNDAAWCDDRATTPVETCAEQSGAALTRALAELQARFGSDVSRWRWDAAHQARSEHRPFSRVRWLAPWFELRAPVGGDTHTVNVSRVSLKHDPVTGELYLDEHGPSLRALYDVLDRSQSRVMHSTGQSGIVFSPLYRSFVAPWRDVRYVPLFPRGGAAQVLTVVPNPRLQAAAR